jgi:hypothetical protein
MTAAGPLKKKSTTCQLLDSIEKKKYYCTAVGCKVDEKVQHEAPGL